MYKMMLYNYVDLQNDGTRIQNDINMLIVSRILLYTYRMILNN